LNPGAEGSATEPTEVSSTGARLVRVFVAPVRLFEELRAHPRTVGALALGVVLSAMATALIPLELWEAGLRDQLLASGSELPENLGTMARVTWVSTIFASVVAWPLFVLMTAGLYALVFLFGLGYEGSFRVTLSISAHALLVAAAGGLLLVPLRVLAGDASLTLSPALFLPFLGEGLARRLLELLEFFNLWAFFLVGVGSAVADGQRSVTRSGAAAVAVAALLALLLAAAAGALAGGGRTGG
jgi:hypothetical protein